MVKINFLATTNRLEFTHLRKYVMVNIIFFHQKFNTEIISSNKVKMKLSHSL